MLFAGSVVLSLALSALCARHPLSRATADVITSCVNPGAVALTFDDGPYEYLKEMVDMLEGAGAKATFFFNGNNYRCIYDEASAERVKYAFDHGFQVGSHTWSHQHLTTLSNDQINSEMARVEEAIVKITGSLPAYTRPPFGEYDDKVRQVAAARGQQLVNWDLDSGDSLGVSVADQKKRYDDIINQHPGSILSLQHEVYESTAREVLPYVIQKLKDAGYSLVTVAECLNDHPYYQSGPPSPRDDTWRC